MLLLEIDMRLINAKIDFPISTSKYTIFFVTNISMALLRRQRPNILRYKLLYATRSFENEAFQLNDLICYIAISFVSTSLHRHYCYY